MNRIELHTPNFQNQFTSIFRAFLSKRSTSFGSFDICIAADTTYLGLLVIHHCNNGSTITSRPAENPLENPSVADASERTLENIHSNEMPA